MVNALDRRKLLTAAAIGGAAAAVGSCSAVMLGSLRPTDAIVDGHRREVDISELQSGRALVIEVAQSPVLIMRRTPQMVQALLHSDEPLADRVSLQSKQPASAQNPLRSCRAEVFVAIPMCTHLDCVVGVVKRETSDSQSVAGPDSIFACPCHGARFDLAGRVFPNQPAPVNLVVPEHRFLNPNLLQFEPQKNT